MRYRWLVLLLLAPATRLAAQSTPAFELGYRFVDVSGNEQMYRTQINDRPGVLLHYLNWDSEAPLDGVLDFFHIDANDVGAGPAGMLRLSAGQVETFKLAFTWRRTDMYSALPAFANPFIQEGIIPGQHTYNRNRDIYDVNLEILPGKKVTPILGFTRNVYTGPGRTTYHLGQDEFALDQDVHSRDDEYRVGLNFDFGPVQGSFIQGWRYYRWTDTVTLRPGAENGNNQRPVLGQDVTADSIDRTTENKTNTPVTSVWVSGQLFSRIKLIGSYIRADASADTNSTENDAGNFVSFQIARFFSGLDESISSRARTDYWRGSARAEINLAPSVDLTGGWSERSRTLDGRALISSLYLDTVTFAGIPVGDLLREITDTTSVKQTDRIFDASVSARQLGPFAINAGWSQDQRNVTLSPEAEDLAAEEGERFERVVNTYGGGISFSKFGFTLSGDYRRDNADAPIFRTDFFNRDRYKARLGWAFADVVRIGGTFQETHANSDVPEFGYSTKVREVMADVEFGLFKQALTIRGSGGEFKADRKILERQPQDFDIVAVAQKEIGHTWEGGLRLAVKRFTLDAGYLWFGNGGSIPFKLDRIRARAEVGFTDHVGAAFEYLRDKYREDPSFDGAGSLANFTGNRYYVGFQWRP